MTREEVLDLLGTLPKTCKRLGITKDHLDYDWEQKGGFANFKILLLGAAVEWLGQRRAYLKHEAFLREDVSMRRGPFVIRTLKNGWIAVRDVGPKGKKIGTHHLDNLEAALTAIEAWR